MHHQLTSSRTQVFHPSRGTSPSLVVFTAVDGAIRQSASGSCVAARRAIDLLESRGVPVVLTSLDSAHEMVALQQDFGERHPFVCDGGRTLYVPRGFFTDLQDLWPNDEEWHVVPLGVADVARAVRLLVSLFQVSGDDVLTVGLGCAWSDRRMLEAVDVPIIVRGDAPDQARLRRTLPAAYLTTASGPAGWCEAVLGSIPT